MLHCDRTQLAGAPALVLYQDSPEAASRNGTVLFHHGLTSRKEDNLKELEALASIGFLAIGIDAAGHGERRWPDFDERFSNPKHHRHFLQAVEETVYEVPRVLDDAIRRWSIDQERIGMCGISMGGYVTFASLLVEPRISVAAPILGSPTLHDRTGDSPHLHPDVLFPRAVLAQNAGEDTSVPPRNARDFMRALQPHYARAPERISYVEFPGVGHFMPPADWERLWGNVTSWFGRFLPEPWRP